MSRQPLRFLANSSCVVLAAVALGVVVSLGSHAQAASLAACGLPDTAPLWVDYGEGSLTADVRAIFARPGVVMATSGPTVPAAFRAAGAATVLFVRSLPALIGDPGDPADGASVLGAADALLKRAQAQTACPTPWIILNELLGASAATPWSANTVQYRANVLTLMQRLASGGARPVLLVHGAPNVAGDAAEWWRQAAQAGGLAYEAYYDARRINGMGAVAGNRRMRLGMRGSLRLFEEIGIPDSQLGLVLGFHSAPIPGIGGRQGLQPREEWLRFVKWNVLAARQVAHDRGLFTVISWGWGTFGPESVDPDKAAAACVYLWTRDSTLCDGPGAAGPDFQKSLTEGQIVLRPGQFCTFAGGPILARQVAALARFTHDRQVALDALFARTLLTGVKVDEGAVVAREQFAIATHFGGKRAAYRRTLARKGATVAIARAIIRDDQRRRAYAAQLRQNGSTQTPLEALADRATAVLAGATCLQDDLPGWGWFPQTDARDFVAPPLARALPFLLDDRTPPAAPTGVTVTAANSGATLTWQPNREVDLAGYAVYSATSSEGPWAPQSTKVLVRPYFQTEAQPTVAAYVVRAVDTSGNVGPPSTPATLVPAP
jgi:hypothetical protein